VSGCEWVDRQGVGGCIVNTTWCAGYSITLTNRGEVCVYVGREWLGGRYLGMAWWEHGWRELPSMTCCGQAHPIPLLHTV